MNALLGDSRRWEWARGGGGHHSVFLDLENISSLKLAYIPDTQIDLAYLTALQTSHHPVFHIDPEYSD